MLPAQPEDVPWPTKAWPEADPPVGLRDTLDALIYEVFTDTDRYGTTYAVVVVQGGTILAERYGGELPHFDREPEPVERDTPLLSWSMAKSVTHALIGLLVRDGKLDVDAPAPVPAWQGAEDPRAAITLQQLLEMRDGLAFVEAYTVEAPSDVVDMLFGSGQDDAAAFAIAKPLAHEPGSVWNYSSGTSNIVARVAGDALAGGEDAMRSYLHRELFDRIGMRSADPRFDAAGTFVGSSYVYATARDFAKFGLLYLRDGVWEGERVLPEGWVDHARVPLFYDEEDDRWYGAHWWAIGDDLGSFWASGYEGQCILCIPPLDVILVRLGKTPDDQGPELRRWYRAVRDAFR